MKMQLIIKECCLTPFLIVDSSCLASLNIPMSKVSVVFLPYPFSSTLFIKTAVNINASKTWKDF